MCTEWNVRNRKGGKNCGDVYSTTGTAVSVFSNTTGSAAELEAQAIY